MWRIKFVYELRSFCTLVLKARYLKHSRRDYCGAAGFELVDICCCYC